MAVCRSRGGDLGAARSDYKVKRTAGKERERSMAEVCLKKVFGVRNLAVRHRAGDREENGQGGRSLCLFNCGRKKPIVSIYTKVQGMGSLTHKWSSDAQ